MSVRTTQFFVELLLLGPAPDSFTHIASGRFQLSGSTNTTFPIQEFFYVSSGGFNIAGEGYLNSIFVDNGPITLTGYSDLVVSYYEFESTGLLQFSGSSSFNTPYVVLESLGGITLTGNILHQQNYNYVSDGNIKLSNILAKLTVFIDPFPFNWSIKRKDVKNFQFSWATENSRVTYFYRVVGKIRQPIYKPITVPNYGKSSSVVLLQASSVAEVCRKLKSRNFIHPILTIEQYTNNLDPTVPYTELTDVTPTYRLLPCADFFVDFDVTVSMKTSSQAMFSIPNPPPVGGISISGIVDFVVTP